MYPFATPNENEPFVIGLSEHTISRKKNEKLKTFNSDASKWNNWKERMMDHYRQSTTKWATVIESGGTVHSLFVRETLIEHPMENSENAWQFAGA